jgi:ATP-dependent exoDNAse (exonuclease V) beta subunit
MYKVGEDLWYPSVTTVIGQADPEKQEALNVWRKNIGFNKAAAKTKAATDRGTAVHEPLDQWLNDQSFVLDEEAPREIAIPYRQIKNALQKNLTEIWCNEQCLVSHELKTAGRVDLIGVWKGQPAIIDFKTASRKKQEDHIVDYFRQETTYSIMLYEMSGILVKNIVTIIGNETLFKPQIFEKNIFPYVNQVNKLFSAYHSSKLK